MKNKYPIILAHESCFKSDNKFATSNYILNKIDDEVKLYNRFCPHRRYPLAEPGEQFKNIKCDFHGLEWSDNCTPIQHHYNLPKYTNAIVNNSGLISLNFTQPEHKWAQDVTNEKNLYYSHSYRGKSSGSWLWMMEIQADLLHIRKGSDSIHPELGEQTNLDDIEMSEGDGWILQTCTTGWWLFVYPYTFIEWSPGCLSINHTTPDDYNNEFGFEWITQLYYDPKVDNSKRKDFESLEYVFKQDVMAIEKQKGPHYPLFRAMNRYEDHCVHFGKWVKNNINFPK